VVYKGVALTYNEIVNLVLGLVPLFFFLDPLPLGVLPPPVTTAETSGRPNELSSPSGERNRS
jgi:hypothetical protein